MEIIKPAMKDGTKYKIVKIPDAIGGVHFKELNHKGRVKFVQNVALIVLFSAVIFFVGYLFGLRG